MAARLVFAADLKQRNIWIHGPGIRSAALPESVERESETRLTDGASEPVVAPGGGVRCAEGISAAIFG